MPYSAKKTGKNEITVYKKDTGETVGHTTPDKYDAYMAALHIHEPEHKSDGGCVGYAKGGEVSQDAKDLSDIAASGEPLAADPEMIEAGLHEMIENAHKERQESRPDEDWRTVAAEKPDHIAPYKRDEEEKPSVMESLKKLHMAKGGEVPGYDNGGPIPDPNADLQDIAPMGTGTMTPSPAAPVQPANPPSIAAPSAPIQATATPKVPLVSSGPALTDQSYMDKANKLLGLNPEEQAGFMKLLGNNAQKGQIGAGIAGIGDAIASGGTLGKVNPGALAKSEDLIQGKTAQGIEGMQTIRGNQEKAFETAQKLEAQDPNSPLSKYAQKAYGDVGKKLGINLNHASASLISDITGKGVEALTSEYEADLKKQGLELQKEQVAATIANQKAERDIAQQGQQLTASEKLGTRTLGNKLEGLIPGTPANVEKKALEQVAGGKTAGPVQVNSRAEYDSLPSGTHYVDSYGNQKVKK